MLWKIYKNDPEVCHYLFGTMHTSTQEAYTFAALAKKYISKTSLYAGEMDLNQAQGYHLTSYFLLKDGTNFSTLYKPKQYDKYRKIVLKALGFDLYQLEQYTPFYITNFMVNLFLPKDNSEPLDHYLWNYARAEGKQLSGVESLSDQIRILESIPLAYQVKVFKDHMKNISTMKSKILKLNKMYERCDLKSLMNATKKSLGSIRKLMLYERNEAMTMSIIKLFNTKPSFVSVGVAHIPGKKGILSLLRQEGYKIQKISH
jgi:uncharacterized protein